MSAGGARQSGVRAGGGGGGTGALSPASSIGGGGREGRNENENAAGLLDGDVPVENPEGGDIPPAVKRAKTTGGGGGESGSENGNGSEDASSYGLLDWLLRAQPAIAATFERELLPLLEEEVNAAYARAAARRVSGAAASSASSSGGAAVTVAPSPRTFTRKTLGRGLIVVPYGRCSLLPVCTFYSSAPNRPSPRKGTRGLLTVYNNNNN
jgi:hypothetical protein